MGNGEWENEEWETGNERTRDMASGPDILDLAVPIYRFVDISRVVLRLLS